MKRLKSSEQYAIMVYKMKGHLMKEHIMEKKKQTVACFDRQRLYELLATVPCGYVITYGSLGEMLGNKKWARAVGNALHKNPDGDKYPCYKVVNAKGELSPAYAFGGKEEQKRRLEAEGIFVENGKVDLIKYEFKTENKVSSYDA